MKLPIALNSLRFVLVLQVALPVLLLLGVMLMVSLSLIGEFIEERMQRDLRLVARTIHLPVSQALEREDLAQLQNSMASVFSLTEVYGAYLFDAQGKRLSSFGVVNPTRRQATEALEKVTEGEFAKYERIRGRRVYSFFMPIFNKAGQPNGLLQVTRRRSDIDDELTTLHRETWIGFLLVSVLIVSILMFTHQQAIGKPLRHILQSMRRVSTGDHQHRNQPRGPQEVKQLAQGMNSMLDAIETAEKSERSQRQAREKMAERLRHSETMAALGQLSAGVAHELGAPLTVVDGRANRLLRRCNNERDSHELKDIRQQVTRMTLIIEQLLSFGRSSHSQKRMLKVADLVSRACSLMADEGERIIVDAGPPVNFNGDALSLEQVLVNLLRNGCQASPQGQVRISWQREDKLLIIMVDDDGPGIAQNQRDEIFEPFVSSKKPGEGSGLGLAIVKRIVKEHEGDVILERSPLGGARFSLRLPLQVDDGDGS